MSTSPVFLSHRDSVKAKFSRHVFEYCPKTTIGHDVWIGFGAKIRSGVKIGNGAVVGMGAVVTRDVEPYMVVAGNPARVVSQRFSNAVAAALNASAWWDMNDADLKANAALFTDPEMFLNSRGLL
ncbi:acetyltransferase [Hoeflea sp. BAL378]|nr:acetyltransferase [Hoeflea sp. BAL378]